MFSASTKTSTPSGGGADPQFNYVTMLLHGDGTNGAQNNTFLDSSTNNLTITKNGSVNQGSFSPYGSNWSNYFGGSLDWLTCPSNSAWTLGSTFTIEAWVYATNLAGGSRRICQSDAGFDFSVSNTGNVLFNAASTTTTILTNTWYHIAFVCNSGTSTLYINGVASGFTGTNTGVNVAGTSTLTVGTYQNNSGFAWQGYISNFRIVKSSAVYTSNFTPSTTPLTAITNTSILTCQSNRFIDNSSNNFLVSANSAPSIQRFNPFGTTTQYSTTTIGGSGYSPNGSVNYLYAPASSNFQYTGDFSVEAWVYTDYNGGGPFWGTGGGGSNDQIYLFGPVSGIYYDGTTFAPFSQESQVRYTSWNHVCLTRQSGVLRMIVNGILNGTKSNSSTLGSNTDNAGIFTRQTGSGDGYRGYLCDLRVSNGSVPTNYQTSSTTAGAVIFTPPTAPLTTTSQGANSSHVKLLVQFTNGAIFDNAMMNDLETVGNAQISTSVVKYGTGSLYFDGTGDGLVNVVTPNLIFGTADFTVEFWIYLAANLVSFAKIIQMGTTGDAFTIETQSTTNLLTVTNFTSTVYFPSNTALTNNTWIHVAVTRSSGTIRLFQNGIQTGSSANTVNFTCSGTGVYIGQSSLGTGMNGYLDDLRITKGYARYTANFTPPSAAFFNTGPY